MFYGSSPELFQFNFIYPIGADNQDKTGIRHIWFYFIYLLVRADFNQKLPIPILCFALKLVMMYHIKHFEGPVLVLWGFYSCFGHNPSLHDVPKPMSVIFPIFVKKCTLEFELDIHWRAKFNCRGFYIILIFHLSHDINISKWNILIWNN